eukprot:TRINITY_DN90956_c0_g1_i1.p1 TRINITY_DN90956_c0_g1~~TRINITY_DN90956_c0_g1_i1.p1  ORF type:complete len:1956 (+),score=491.78 TRINITY_DN90956_c0_g1_i1:121-5988(+)
MADDPPPAAAFVDYEAEESGAEAGGGDAEAEAAAGDDGADLQDFVVSDEQARAEAAAASAEAAAAAGSASSEEEGELEEDDFAVLAEAGFDTSQIPRKRPRPEEAGEENEEDRAKRQREAERREEDERDLFGDEEPPSGPSGLPAALAPLMDAEGGGVSDAESIQSFIVEDPAAKRRRGAADEAREFGLSEDQMQQVRDIFGDASVLRPIDEIDYVGEEESSAPAAVIASLAAAEAKATAAAAAEAEPLQDAEALQQVVPSSAASAKPDALFGVFSSLDMVSRTDLDPDVMERTYQLPRDKVLEATDAPERWLQAFQQQPELLDEKGNRVFTDEEYQCEARWIYNEVFAREEDVDRHPRGPTEDAIRRILVAMHEKKLELIYIVEQLYWQVQKVLLKEDLWKIAEYDLIWQPIWSRYILLTDWAARAEAAQVQLPQFVKDTVERDVWNSLDAELNQKDVQDWFHVMYPEHMPPLKHVQRQAATSTDTRIKTIRDSKLDEQLGVRESIQDMNLRAFGITPAELGENVANQRAIHTPQESDDDWRDICGKFIDQNFRTAEAVKDEVMYYLSRLVATEPRVRAYVRQEFWKRVVISTEVTQAGKHVAKKAAHSFNESYRAFRIAHRPASKFEGSALYLDVLHLQKKGFITVDYDLVEELDKGKLKVVMRSNDRTEVGLCKQRMATHYQRKDDRREVYEPKTEKELADWKWCEETIPKLTNVIRTKEASQRREASQDGNLKDKVTANFMFASKEFSESAVSDIMVADPIFESLCLLYCSTQDMGNQKYEVILDQWNPLRKSIIKRALVDELYPMIWAEVQDHLAKKSDHVVCSACREELTKMLDRQPWVPDDKWFKDAEAAVTTKLEGDNDDDEGAAIARRRQDPAWQSEKDMRKAGLCSVLIVLPEAGETSICGYVNAFGEAIDMRQLFKDFVKKPRPIISEPGSFMYDKAKKIIEHREVFKQMVATYKPAVILLAVTDPNILAIKANLDEILNDTELVAEFAGKVLPMIRFSDTRVPRAVAYSKRVMSSVAYADYNEPSHRIAISCARFHQDPWAEACQLWHELPDENGLFSMKLHRLQQELPREMLTRTITRTLQEIAVKTGLHVNQVRRSKHLESTIAFFPGLGPRKAKLFLQVLNDPVKSADSIAHVLAKQLKIEDPSTSSTLENLLPFIRIKPDFRDAWTIDEVPGLDRTRIGSQIANWAKAICGKVLEGQASDPSGSEDEGDKDGAKGGDVVARVMRRWEADPNFEAILQETDWDDWQERAGVDSVPACANPDKLFDLILQELREPFKDCRTEYEDVPYSDLMYMALAESNEELKTGCIIRAKVRSDEEYPDKDTEKVVEEGKLPKVKVRVVPSMVSGFFVKTYKDGHSAKTGYIKGCNHHFVQGEIVTARVKNIRPPGPGATSFNISLSVDTEEDTWYETFPVKEADLPYFVPSEQENWTKVALGLTDNSALKKKAELKDWVRRSRNIKHPNFSDADYTRGYLIIDNMYCGGVLFRPSKHNDVIIGMLKVLPTQRHELTHIRKEDRTDEVCKDLLHDPRDCFRSFDIFEILPAKTWANGFEQPPEMEVEGYRYKDFDEVIARHMDPIADNLRILQEHPRYGVQEGNITKRDEVRECMKKFSAGNSLLHISFLTHHAKPGHGVLLWTVRGREPREEFIEVTPEGYKLWLYGFSNLNELVKWFKHVGWRNAKRCRQDFKEDWKTRLVEAKARRGDNCDPDAEKKRSKGLEQAETTTSGGLQTPGGSGLSTPTTYQFEGAAPTPGGGLRTPRGSNPMSPAPMTAYQNPGTSIPGTPGQAPGTPGAFQQRQFVPATPSGLGLRTPAGVVPGTPAGAPGTPGFRPGGTPGIAVPSTPAGAFKAAGTPGGIVPQTPAAAFGSAAPQTPAGAFGGTMTPGNFRAVGTPGSFVPMTPGAAAPMTPGGAMPFTPRPAVPTPGRFAGPQTPGNAVPQTPGR